MTSLHADTTETSENQQSELVVELRRLASIDCPYGCDAIAARAADRMAFMEDESDRLHDDVARLMRERNAFAEVNAWRDGWMRRAVHEMNAVLDAHGDGLVLSDNSVACMEALIAEEWSDGEDDPDA